LDELSKHSGYRAPAGGFEVLMKPAWALLPAEIFLVTESAFFKV
jgi:hypothetical protein